MAQRSALLISNSQYNDRQLLGLAAPAGDAAALGEVLKNPQIGAFDAVQTLLNRPFGEIQEAIVALFAGKKPEDVVLLYFSGHGLLDESRKLFLATPETSHILPRAKSIAAAFIAEEMSSSRAGKQVLVLDCCHSGAFSRGVKAALNQPVGLESIFHTEGKGRVVLTASDATQYAFEGDALQGQGVRSLFTNYLVEGLESGEADADGDGRISAQDWYDYAYQRVKAEGHSQTPLLWSYGQEGQLILANNPRPSGRPGAPAVVQPPAAKTARTLVVDPLCRGDYETIGAAIANAQPGDRILIRAGAYHEALIIDKPLEIIGEEGEVEIYASGANVVKFQTTAGVLRGLSLRQAGGGDFDAVDIPQGSPRLEHCDISSESRAGVGIHGQGTKPTLRGNKIHDGKSAGILVWENAQGLIQENEIWENAYSGIEIKTGAAPTVRGNKIHDGKSGGIIVYENAQGLIQENEIWGNALVGITITTGAAPTLRGNKIHDGKSAGILVTGNAQGLIHENEIWGNALVGITITTGAAPTVRGNKIHDGKSAGILVTENGQGLIQENEIWGNALTGIQITAGAAPTVRGNKIHDGKDGGIAVYENAQGLIQENEIWGNALVGITITTGAAPTVRGNKIHEGKQNGILVNENAQGLIQENEIWGNAYSGIEIRTGAAPTVRGNTITKNTYQAIYIHDKGGGMFEDNDLRGNVQGAWVIADDSQVLVTRKNNRET